MVVIQRGDFYSTWKTEPSRAEQHFGGSKWHCFTPATGQNEESGTKDTGEKSAAKIIFLSLAGAVEVIVELESL